MFKNPLKYQEGGEMDQKEKLVQLFQEAARNAQVDPEALVQKAQELGDDQNAAAQFMEGLQRCAQGDPTGIKFIQDLFKKPAFRKGGKIYEFICKHAKGGKTCGCQKAQNGVSKLDETNPRGYSSKSDYYRDDGTWASTEEHANGMSRITLNTRSKKRPIWSWMHDDAAYLPGPAGFEIEPDTYRSYQTPEVRYVSPTYWKWLNTQMDVAKKYGGFDLGNGGKVRSAQTGFKAPTRYINEKGWPISEDAAFRRKNRTFYTEEPTPMGNLAWSSNEMAKDFMYPGVVQPVEYRQPVGHYIDEEGNMHNFAVEGNDLVRYNNRKAQWHKNGGLIEKAQKGKGGLGTKTTWVLEENHDSPTDFPYVQVEYDATGNPTGNRRYLTAVETNYDSPQYYRTMQKIYGLDGQQIGGYYTNGMNPETKTALKDTSYIWASPESLIYKPKLKK